MSSINDLRLGQSARVAGIATGGALSQRLMAMGLLPGSLVKLVRVAPLGDPITVETEGCQLSLRRAEAAGLELHDEPTAV